jgi:hypothetical protein
MNEHLQPDLTDIKYALEKCLNTRTVGDIRDLLNDGNINPILKELIEGLEIEMADATAKDRSYRMNISLKQLTEAFEEN